MIFYQISVKKPGPPRKSGGFRNTRNTASRCCTLITKSSATTGWGKDFPIYRPQ